jgi:signal transduction histidine kinase
VTFELFMLFSLAIAGIVKEVLVSYAQERQLHSDLQKAHQQLEVYASQVKELGATEERNRLARDIHDSIGHYLAAVTVQLEKALAFRLIDSAKSERAILDAQQAARDALRDVRRSVGALRQSAEFFSLTIALEDLVRRLSNDRFTVDLKVEGNEIGYSRSTLMALYRVAQESLTNIQKHAEAEQARITLRMGNQTASLTVDDNGQGFDTELGSSSREHQGLRGIRERLELVGGQLTLDSNSQAGTKLMAVVPKLPRALPKGAA